MPLKTKPLETATEEYIKQVDPAYIEIDKRTQPDFIWDVCPYFLDHAMVLITLTLFWATGNMLLGCWVIYVGTPLYNLLVHDDSKNLDKKVERSFAQSKLFFIPLYTYVLLCMCLWLYGMVLMSTKFKVDHWLFDYKIESTSHYIIFLLVVTFHHALCLIAGHEIFHNKELIHKIVGSIPYTMAFYSHFWDEHVKNHHKAIATPEDPVSHPKGMNLYYAIASAFVRTHA